ncbi:MAG: precorrin-6y C5,15-methyltransferase (decarboxylating) subunit CbiE [Candidatus Electrothrix sp. AW2]|nr:precorrin-6y C5,15-methyltransferase (decarboxylating) subunit CbiE [Candidatus Electrothrix gigas]MCI5225834.1 precorrin-6y C5,15-methyltransferase (decarboxylating) subunit CbiE [Candidatus Electrothrix gigas]
MSEVFIFGVSGDKLPKEQRRKITTCYAVVISTRHKALLKGIQIHRIPIAPVEEMVFELAVALNQGDVAVLASGDPLFFGIGRTLLERFGPERVHITPALSAVQLACTRFKLPWDDLPLISLHGRSPGDLAGRILTKPKVMLFTDHRNSPNHIAKELLTILEEHNDTARIKGIRIRVAENLGCKDERLSRGTLADIAGQEFSQLNMMLIEQREDEWKGEQRDQSIFGLQENEIEHSRGLITKDEIRAVILHRLRLPQNGILWDVGGGAGSVSVEAARLCPGLTIYIIEQKAEAQKNIRANILHYNLYNIKLICGMAPDALTNLPDPDRVFIGGSKGLLAEIIPRCAQRLTATGRMVASAILKDTAEQAPLLMASNGLKVDSRTVAVTREEIRYTNYGEPGILLNPITIITGRK